MPVAVVTDSTAYLPAEQITRWGLTVVPLFVVIDGVERREGVDITPGEIHAVLRGRFPAVSTSRPAPARFAEAYRRLLAGGASGVLSVHLSAELSGTCAAATSAAAEVGGQVSVLDTRGVGMGTGFAVLAAARAAASGAGLAEVRAAALAATTRTSTFFYVETLEFLRRGGRIGAASALLGTALSVKPILHVLDGRIVARDRVRTSGRALARLVELVAEQAGRDPVDVAVHHLDDPARAAHLTGLLADRLGDQLGERYTSEVGAVVAAHVGPGLAGVVLHRRDGPAGPARAGRDLRR